MCSSYDDYDGLKTDKLYLDFQIKFSLGCQVSSHSFGVNCVALKQNTVTIDKIPCNLNVKLPVQGNSKGMVGWRGTLPTLNGNM